MAQCEKCGSTGHDMRDMMADAERKTFVGPCCVRADAAKMFEKSEVQYGIEISSHMGVRAYASYNGLSVEFKKTKEEIASWVQETKKEMEVNPTPETEQTVESSVLN